MADIDLQVWTFRPNWSTPVTERLEFKTDVMTSRIGTEQRRATRVSPRRYFEYKVNPTGPARSYFDQWAHRIGESPILHPTWHDKAWTTEAALPGDTAITVATEYREFTAGGLAILYADTFDYEVVQIDTVSVDGLTLADPLVKPWLAGTTVYPVRRSYLSPDVRLSNLTDSVGEATVEFMVDGPNDYPLGVETRDLYKGFPVISLQPNRLDDLTTQYDRIMSEFDGGTGLIYRYDEGARAFAVQFYNWQARGLQAHHELRQLIYRMFGRLNPSWISTFNSDVVLTSPLASVNTGIDIQEIGYEKLGGVAAGRNHIAMRDADGAFKYLEISDVGPPPGLHEERLVLQAAAGFNAPEGSPGSFMDLVRLDQDLIEITHHTDSMGVCEASAAFKAFNPARVPAAPFIVPIPLSEKGADPCGSAPATPCTPILEERDWQIRFRLEYDSMYIKPGARLRGQHIRLVSQQGQPYRPIWSGLQIPMGEPFYIYETTLKNGTGSLKYDPRDYGAFPLEFQLFMQWEYGSWTYTPEPEFKPLGAVTIYYQKATDPTWVGVGTFGPFGNHWPEYYKFTVF